MDQERLLGVPWLVDARIEFTALEEPLFRRVRDQSCSMFGEVAPESRDFDGAMFNDRWGWLFYEKSEGYQRMARARSKWLRDRPRHMKMELLFKDFEMIEGLIPHWRSLQYTLRLK
jgi:hypothetical protein